MHYNKAYRAYTVENRELKHPVSRHSLLTPYRSDDEETQRGMKIQQRDLNFRKHNHNTFTHANYRTNTCT